MGTNLQDFGLGNCFLDYDTKSTSSKRKKKLTFNPIKMKNCCASMETTEKVKKHTEEKILTNQTSDRARVFRVYLKSLTIQQ